MSLAKTKSLGMFASPDTPQRGKFSDCVKGAQDEYYSEKRPGERVYGRVYRALTAHQENNNTVKGGR